MPIDTKLFAIIQQLVQKQMLAVLGTETAGQPYCSLVAFAGSADLREIYFVTERESSKYIHLLKNAHVALLLDNRQNQEMDFMKAVAIQALGIARECDARETDRYKSVFLAKHPALQSFVDSAHSAFFCVTVGKYKIVSEFLRVEEWTP